MSVRSADEARAALEGGASIIDIKEPSRGPLGAAAPEVRRWVVEACALWIQERRPRPGRVAITAAAGELIDHDHGRGWESVEGIRHHKLGLSRAAGLDWRGGLARWAGRLARERNPSTLVAVAYADHVLAGSPDPAEVLHHAIELRLPVFLLDTFEKGRRTLRSWIEDHVLAEFIATARQGGVRVALAGSLRPSDFAALAPLGPDILAVRGAACRGSSRDEAIDAVRVAALARCCGDGRP